MILPTIDAEFKALIPPLSEQEYQQLEANILQDGCRDALVVWNGTLIDGHNRFEICQRHELPYQTVAIDLPNRNEALLWIIRNQLGRRNLPDYVRIKLALRLKPVLEEKAKENQLAFLKQGNMVPVLPNLVKREPLNVQEELASIAGKSKGNIAKVELIEERAAPALKQALEQGDVSIHQAWQEVKREERKQERVEAILGQVKTPLDFNELPIFPVIYADPPWRYEHSISDSRAIENQYPTMTLEDICALPISEHITPDAILFLWVTSPKLAEGLQVIDAWGFTYRTCAVWIKDKLGMGYYFRQQHELLLVSTRGNMVTPEPNNRVSSVIQASYNGHSRKPDVVYEVIEAMYPEFPKLELFARSQRDNWFAWGNEINE